MKKICLHCQKENPIDATYCIACGNFLSETQVKLKDTHWKNKIPSIVWILLAVGAIILFIGLIIGTFWALSNMEGLASFLFLILGVFAFQVFSGKPPGKEKMIRAIGIGFFAFMGMSIDQTGNYVYNKPIEYICCPDKTTLTRDVEVSHPIPGSTYMTQDFRCVGNNQVLPVNQFAVIGIRFLEYLFIGYFLVGIRWVFWKGKSNYYKS